MSPVLLSSIELKIIQVVAGEKLEIRRMCMISGGTVVALGVVEDVAGERWGIWWSRMGSGGMTRRKMLAAAGIRTMISATKGSWLLGPLFLLPSCSVMYCAYPLWLS